MAKVLLSAEHHNWGLCTADDWHQTNYTLYDDYIYMTDFARIAEILLGKYV